MDMGRGGPRPRASRAMALVAAQNFLEQVLSFGPTTHRHSPLRKRAGQTTVSTRTRWRSSRSRTRGSFLAHAAARCSCLPLLRALAFAGAGTAAPSRLVPAAAVGPLPLQAACRSPASPSRT
jgi:hypothetical protein